MRQILVVVSLLTLMCGCGKPEQAKKQRAASEADRLWQAFQKDVWKGVESNLVEVAAELPDVGELHDTNAVLHFRTVVAGIRTIVSHAKKEHDMFVDRLRKVKSSETDDINLLLELEDYEAKKLDLHLEKCEAMEELVGFLLANTLSWTTDDCKECAVFEDKSLRRRYHELLGRVIILDMHVDPDILETYRQAKFFGRRFAE